MAIRYSSGNPTLDMLMGGMGNRESGMNFRAIGPVTRNGDRAYGFSQVMGSNVGPWTQEVLGVRMSPQQYLNNPEAQYAVTSAKLGGYLSQYGNPEDALSMWHSGRPMARSTQANDGFVNTHDYVKQIMASQDPNSFMASASPQATGAAPMQLPGATLAGDAQGSPQGSVGPQSISLGNEEQQPLNNIGSTLANMGASIASLDRGGTGIASLNASNVARNLAAQEALREKQGGWKYAGQTDNGQGLIFQNTKGETRIEPLSPQFAGQKESSTTQMLREMQANPSLLNTYKQLHGGDDVTLSQEAINSAAKRVIGGEKGVLTRMSKGNAARIAEEVAAQTGDDPGQILENQIASTGKSAEARTIGTSVGKSAVSAGTFASGVTNALQASSSVPRNNFIPLNKLDQMIAANMSDENLLDFKAAHETLIREYSKAINPNGTPTVSDMNHARELLSTATSQPAYEKVVRRLENEVANKQKNLEKLNTGNKPEQGVGSTGLPAVGKKTIINGVEIERLD